MDARGSILRLDRVGQRKQTAHVHWTRQNIQILGGARSEVHVGAVEHLELLGPALDTVTVREQW